MPTDFYEEPIEDAEENFEDEVPEMMHIVKPFENHFRPEPIYNYIPQLKVPDEKSELASCVQEGSLLNASSVHGLMIVISWELKLDGVDDKAVKLMLLAVRHKMKSLLMALVSRRKAYKIREQRFKYAAGCPSVNNYLRNSQKLAHYSDFSNLTSVNEDGIAVGRIRPTLDWAVSEAAMELACDTAPQRPTIPISPWDLFDVLRVHPSVIPSHSVYATIMEKTILSLSHPSLEEVEQESIKQQEKYLRDVTNTSLYDESYPHPAMGTRVARGTKL